MTGGDSPVVLGVLVVVVVVAVLEVAVRIWLRHFASEAQVEKYALITRMEPRKIRLTPHPYLGYYNTPNYRKGLKSHNSLGYRNDEFPIKKPVGVFRIAVLGGSTVYTELVEDNAKQFTTQLENVLSEKFGYANVHVVNAGVPGFTSYESLVDLALRILDLEPDLVVVYHGTNDCHTRFVAANAYRGDNSGYRKHWDPPRPPPWQHLAALRVLSRRLGLSQQAMLEQFVETPTAEDPTADQMDLLRAHPPVFYERNLESTIALAKHHRVGVMFATWAHSPHLGDYAAEPHYVRCFREMNETKKRVASRNGIPLFDFAAVMPTDPKYWGDGRHVNEAGALLKAELFAAFMHEQGLITAAPTTQASPAAARDHA